LFQSPFISFAGLACDFLASAVSDQLSALSLDLLAALSVQVVVDG